MADEERKPLPLESKRDYASTPPSTPSPSRSDTSASNPKPSCILAVAAAAALLGSSFQFGYNNSVINTTGGLIKDWINSTYDDDRGNATIESTAASNDNITLVFSIVVSIWAIGGLIGSLSAGYFADRFGRRKAMLINNAVALAAGILMGVAKKSGSVVPLIIGRLVSGLNCGANTVFSPMYLAEVRSWRGFIPGL